jgi:hypothetical protein
MLLVEETELLRKKKKKKKKKKIEPLIKHSELSLLACVLFVKGGEGLGRIQQLCMCTDGVF